MIILVNPLCYLFRSGFRAFCHAVICNIGMSGGVFLILFIHYQGIDCTVIRRWTKWFASYIFIMFHKRNSRMFKYNMKSKGLPFKVGFFIPPQEWNLECFSENEETDEMFCFGINSIGECLAVQITRECACDSSSSLFLKINDSTYSLPLRLNYLKGADHKTFGNDRFYMQCLAPFRKWKIFFNGMLREITPTSGRDRIIHVRLSFIWVASAGVFDFMSDYSSSNMVDILSETKWNSFKPPIDRLLSILNEYHQPGMLHGTVQIEDKKEHEMYLWGCRRHNFSIYDDADARESYSIDMFGNAENGFLFYLKIMSVKKFVKRNISGFIMLPNGSLKAAQILSVKKMERYQKTILFFRIKAGHHFHTISAFFYGYGGVLGKGTENSSISVIDVLVDSIWGSGIAVKRLYKNFSRHKSRCKPISVLLKEGFPGFMSIPKPDPLVLTLEDRLCTNKDLSGNIGSSLAKLIQMKSEVAGYHVPNGLVITTSSYQHFASSVRHEILTLKENIINYDIDELKPFCNRIEKEICNSLLPADIFDDLCRKLHSILQDSKNTKFCIFGSIAGEEPGVQLLEAYLSTFSEVVGLAEIIRKVKMCWASQFSFNAIVCKRYSGQCLNKPMAVVVQKMVSFTSSGVITTCDSFSGNPSIMEIREEFLNLNKIRIILLKRDMKNLLKVLDNIMHCDGISEKDPSSRNVEIINDNRGLSKEQVILLGKIAIKIENSFRHPLCVEWCLNKNKVFILQVRSMSFINDKTKFEMLHYWDSYLRTEDEWFSTFNAGEGCFEAVSPLGIELLNFCLEIYTSKMKSVNPERVISDTPYFPKFLVSSYRHLLFCLADGLFCFQSPQGFFMKSLALILNCKGSEELALQDLIRSRHGEYHLSLRMIFHVIYISFFSGWRMKSLESKIWTCDFNFDNVDTAIDVLDIMSFHYQDISEPFINYINCSHSATIWSMIVLYILKKIRGNQNQDDVNKDFNFFMSEYSECQEGDIPTDMLALSRRVARNVDPKIFKEMSIEDAKIWLEDVEMNKKVRFSDFIERHGHRSLKEVDIFEKCWSMDPRDVIRALQNIMPLSNSASKRRNTVDAMFSQLHGTPNCFLKFMLKLCVSKCVIATREAKRTKSNFLRAVSSWRKAFHHLADIAVKEFRIPFPEMLFFLNLEDIRHLLRAESFHLVTKAIKFWEIHSDVNKYIFPAISIGLPCPLSENYYHDKRLKIGAALKGSPVSRGTVVGTAVVAAKLEDMPFVENGSILITPSPSIAWSLYFPILGGFATDIGGLLSDGAVSAREFGIPCVINLVRASHILETGDRVLLDGNMGFLRRLPPI